MGLLIVQDQGEGTPGDCIRGVGGAHPCLDQVGHTGTLPSFPTNPRQVGGNLGKASRFDMIAGNA